jgi:hypothetical protein
MVVMDAIVFYHFKNILHTYMLPIAVPIMFFNGLLVGGFFRVKKAF